MRHVSSPAHTTSKSFDFIALRIKPAYQAVVSGRVPQFVTSMAHFSRLLTLNANDWRCLLSGINIP